MKNGFNFMLKALFVLNILTFLSWLFGYVEKQLEKEGMVKVVINGQFWDTFIRSQAKQNTSFP